VYGLGLFLSQAGTIMPNRPLLPVTKNSKTGLQRKIGEDTSGQKIMQARNNTQHTIFFKIFILPLTPIKI
jgi:hypothetical protein